MSAWRQLAEILRLSEADWNKVNRQRNMQRWGTQDRRTNNGPMPYFKPDGSGSAQRQQTAADMRPDMTPRPGGMQIPTGADVPQQGPNPLYGMPTKAAPRLSRSANMPPDDDEDY